MTVPVFLLFFASGLGVGIADRSLSPLRTRWGKIFTVLSDVFLALGAVGLHAVVMFALCDGHFFFYGAAAEAVGYLIGRALLAAVIYAFRILAHNKKRRSRLHS